jgi:isoaspartyl peptidase/L-asparaginase-like protein (Ntn-hydrolase superfamily)
VIVVHGGAGTIARERYEAVQNGCLRAARIGWSVLRGGGDALSAVVEAVAALEDDPEFNAGRGAALTRAGTVELDAAVMRGCDRAAGAVGCVRMTRNPIRLARAVMDTEHVLLVADSADALAREIGLETVSQDYFVTERQCLRLDAYLRAQTAPRTGTAGAVAVDAEGRVAAATSTGGRVGQRPGRVGDTPIPGAGTYADRAGAASGTGEGEYFIRSLAAYRAVRVLPGDAQAAAEHGVAAVTEFGGSGGLIVVSATGGIGVAFNTTHMAWAWMRDGAEQSGI